MLQAQECLPGPSVNGLKAPATDHGKIVIDP
ncbi:hypothetical protein F441_11749 [Phytophthora nicotianae CJ01A1]|uniref:Uncharacterized protein n=6 Tax=Phytophthora nicotianae TaxID=4792 RepID=W2Q1R7_PHYN3|nr:hypothetical protein PPTG_23305 [Phytophthora nicotianae INRA-310]ETI43243.1 hypothetical protein F443_11794 [Phytophthora nicotianae P1569]ETK83298.1 hypothetical protein L915_11492 [Phytophthora nicotianae]ETO71895.1 hypothetical protein F444_11877 [Phytophthora nicotianae P1976]ETP13012.1 hypothetical protein F441_11749 [Phytophthora nicotianae CJ01A1]ETP41066.1 hypothetical protein F442_11701 [Phytophthora nicotianae P10297]